MMQLLLVAAGGAIGATLRHLTNVAAFRIAGPAFPWGTVAVNLVGCFAMGVFIEFLARRLGGSMDLRLFVATGILGGFTTFSAFSLDFAVLVERGAMAVAFGYAALSVVGSLAALFAGLALARLLF
jgi:fluoride exporter